MSIVGIIEKKKHFVITKYLSMAEVGEISGKKGIRLLMTKKEKTLGWLGMPKGLLQVLWERGMIDSNKLSEYSMNGKKSQLDNNGNIKEEYKKYILPNMMQKCTDFKEEKTAMQHLLTQLYEKKPKVPIHLDAHISQISLRISRGGNRI